MEVIFEITGPDAKALCQALVGAAHPSADMELPGGMRLQYRGLSKDKSRDTGLVEILLFALNVPLSVTASVAASLILEHLRSRGDKHAREVCLRGENYCKAIGNLNEPRASQEIAAAIERQRVAESTNT